MAAQPVYLLFKGFPGPYDPNAPVSRKKACKATLDEDRMFSAVHASTHQWKPGEPRALETDPGFDAAEFAEGVLADYGPESSAVAHLPEGDRASFGFKLLSAADYKKAQTKWQKDQA